MKVEILVKNSCSTLGEAPHWEERSQSLLYVDIGKGDIHRWCPESKTDQVLNLEVDHLSAIVPRYQGGYIINQGRALKQLDWETKSMTTLHEVDKEYEHILNDGKCDAAGRFWAGTITDPKTKTMPQPNCALYSLEVDGSLNKRYEGVKLSNGIAWSLDNTIMYYIDTYQFEIAAFDFDLSTGNITNKRTAYKLKYAWGALDGMTVDAEGKIWVAVFGSGKVLRIDPETGVELTSVTIPGQMNTTSCCFGGKDYSELYVTSSNSYLTTDINGESHEPNAGSLFRVTDLGVKGLPANGYGLNGSS